MWAIVRISLHVSQFGPVLLWWGNSELNEFILFWLGWLLFHLIWFRVRGSFHFFMRGFIFLHFFASGTLFQLFCHVSLVVWLIVSCASEVVIRFYGLLRCGGFVWIFKLINILKNNRVWSYIILIINCFLMPLLQSDSKTINSACLSFIDDIRQRLFQNVLRNFSVMVLSLWDTWHI